MKIFYFSGTGNAKKTANWILEYASQNNIKAEVSDITKSNPDSLIVSTEDIIGFISPTHGFNFPPIMLSFLLHFPATKNRNKVFIINTRAGMKFKKLYFPGLSGIAQLFSALILLFKGYKIVGMMPIDLPSNWISLHPGLSDNAIKDIFERCKTKTINFAKKIIKGERSYIALHDIIQDLLLAPVSVLYYCIGRFVFAKSYIATSGCDNCGLCINQCPVKAISIKNNKPFWSYKCESCMKCMNNCPRRAIETAHGFVIGTCYLVNVFLISYLYNFCRQNSIEVITGNSLFSGVIRFIIEPAILISILIISYRIVHFLKQFSFFEKVIVYTSLTKYKFWRRYKAIKNI